MRDLSEKLTAAKRELKDLSDVHSSQPPKKQAKPKEGAVAAAAAAVHAAPPRCSRVYHDPAVGSIARAYVSGDKIGVDGVVFLQGVVIEAKPRDDSGVLKEVKVRYDLTGLPSGVNQSGGVSLEQWAVWGTWVAEDPMLPGGGGPQCCLQVMKQVESMRAEDVKAALRVLNIRTNSRKIAHADRAPQQKETLSTFWQALPPASPALEFVS